MTRVDFYQLTRDPAVAVAAMLARKLSDGGLRGVIVAGEGSSPAALSEALWSVQPTAFVAHGLASADDAAEELLLIADTAPGFPAANGATHVIAAHGHWSEAYGSAERVFLLFGADQTDGARATWRMLKGQDDRDLHYWRQDQGSGRWIEGP